MDTEASGTVVRAVRTLCPPGRAFGPTSEMTRGFRSADRVDGIPTIPPVLASFAARGLPPDRAVPEAETLDDAFERATMACDAGAYAKAADLAILEHDWGNRLTPEVRTAINHVAFVGGRMLGAQKRANQAIVGKLEDRAKAAESRLAAVETQQKRTESRLAALESERPVMKRKITYLEHLARDYQDRLTQVFKSHGDIYVRLAELFPWSDTPTAAARRNCVLAGADSRMFMVEEELERLRSHVDDGAKRHSEHEGRLATLVGDLDFRMSEASGLVERLQRDVDRLQGLRSQLDEIRRFDHACALRETEKANRVHERSQAG